MSLRVYNTLTRQKEDFQTVVPGKVGMYLCGPTVYKPAHIGHMVGPVIFDSVKRYLTYLGYAVKFVINITDVDDKLIVRAAERQTTVEKLAREMTQDYFDNLQTMGVDSVDLFPYATEHIPEMLDIIRRLIDKGFAYPLEGDVYFDVTRDEDYGALSHRSISEVVAGTRVEANDRKRHPADFALWKKSKPGEPAWESPWGPGRPGWHIECSAMSMKYLGETLDIHGGGLDLMFPHHENELAQSESCTGKMFSRYWMHNGLMQSGKASGKVGGGHDRHGDAEPDKAAQEAGKLAGSKGAASVKELFARHAPETVRFFVLSTHYRSPIDFSDDNIASTGKSIEGFYELFRSFERETGVDFYSLSVWKTQQETHDLTSKVLFAFASSVNQAKDRFDDAMDDDFNTGGAVAVLFDFRRILNSFLSPSDDDAPQRGPDKRLTGDAKALVVDAMKIFRTLASILGVFLKPREERAGGTDIYVSLLALIQELFAEARSVDWTITDEIKSQVAALQSAGKSDPMKFKESIEQAVQIIISMRGEARKNKNWAMSDKIRDRLKTLRIVIEDRPDKATWRIE